MSVQARFFVSEIRKTPNPFLGVALLPVTRSTDDNVDWAKWTPSGKIDLNVSAESVAAAWFEDRLGKDVAISFDDIDPRAGSVTTETGEPSSALRPATTAEIDAAVDVKDAIVE